MSQPVVTRPEARPAAPRRPDAARSGGWLLLMAVILLIYGVFYGRQIMHTSAVPTFDQAAYMEKTYAIADAVYAQPWRLLLPKTYLGEPAANRPPLLPAIAGLVLGPAAGPQAIGLCWLALRLAALGLGLWVLAKRVGSAAFAPAAALAILAQPGWHILYPNMYMMDQPFEAFGLLAFAWLMNDLHHRTTRTAAWAALGTLLLALIKPAAGIFLLPLYVLLARRALDRYRAEGRPAIGRRALIRWLWPYAVLAAALAVLYISPHGQAVIDQYRLGSRGYWHSHLAWPARLGMLALLLPPWLLVLAAVALGRRTWRNQPVAAVGLLVAAWWFIFNAFITYTLDPRIVPAAAPLAITALVLVCWRWRPLGLVTTSVAALVFALSIASSHGVIPRAIGEKISAAAPLSGPQPPIAEVGLLPAARALGHIVQTVPPADRRVMIVASDDFVELAALRLALRYTGGAGSMTVDSHPWGAADFRLSGMLSFHFFLTKDRRPATALEGDVWTSLDGINALIQEPASPLHSLFVVRAVWPIHQPDMDDTLTLWQLVRQPTRAEQIKALEYLQPRFAHTAGAAEIAQELAARRSGNEK